MRCEIYTNPVNNGTVTGQVVSGTHFVDVVFCDVSLPVNVDVEEDLVNTVIGGDGELLQVSLHLTHNTVYVTGSGTGTTMTTNE